MAAFCQQERVAVSNWICQALSRHFLLRLLLLLLLFSFLIVLRSSTTWRPCVSNMIISICMCACVHTCCDFQCCHIQYFFASYLFFSLLLCCWFLSPTLRAVRIKLLCMIWIIIELENHSHSNMSVPGAQAHLEPHTYSCVVIYAILVATTCYAFLLRKLFSNCTLPLAMQHTLI